jgi:hypothetical protein
MSLRKSAAKFGFKMAMQKVKKEIKKDGDITLAELNRLSKIKRKADIPKPKPKQKKKVQPSAPRPRSGKTVLSIDKTTEFRVIKKQPKKKPKNGGLSISELKDITAPPAPRSGKAVKTKKQRKRKTRTEMDKKKLLRRTHRLDEKRKRKRKKKPLTGMTQEETARLNRFVAGINIKTEKIKEAERKMIENFIKD